MYTDLLTKIKNAQSAKKTGLKTYYSNMDFAILEVLVKHKFLQDVSKKGRMPKRAIDITLKYKDGEGAISGLKFLSSPSRRLYLGYKDIKRSEERRVGKEC